MQYLFLKLFHLLAVIVYIGNMTAGLYWIYRANKTRDFSIINFTLKGIKSADRYFTLPAVILLTGFGLWAAIQGSIPIMGSGWIAWSITLLLVSGLAFSFGVIPLQKKMIRHTSGVENPGESEWNRYRRMTKMWFTWALTAYLTALSAVIMMALKLPQ
ncbi:MAG: DUF2269 family protein [Bacteroidales bacterium]